MYPYALTKKPGELSLHWAEVYKINVTSLRLFNVYGTIKNIWCIWGSFGSFLAQKMISL